jgi:exosome complex RNA-binding protein Rrp42 (RNase PH superfamily)
MEAELYLKACPEDYYSAFLKEGVRPDGRALTEARQAAVQLNVCGAASALVRLGNTSVICVVTEEEKSGLTVIGAADPALLSGLNNLKLKGTVELRIVQDDGNLLEAAVLAYQMAKISQLEPGKLPQLGEMCFAFTYCDLQNSPIRDPTKEESALAASELSIVWTGDGAQVLPVKVGGKPVDLADLERLMTLAAEDLSALQHNLAAISTQRKFVGSLYLATS